MKFKEAWGNLQTASPFCETNYNAMFDIDFENNKTWDGTDETEFTISGECSQEQCEKELRSFWIEFCKESNIHSDSVISITYVGQDPEI